MVHAPLGRNLIDEVTSGRATLSVADIPVYAAFEQRSLRVWSTQELGDEIGTRFVERAWTSCGSGPGPWWRPLLLRERRGVRLSDAERGRPETLLRSLAPFELLKLLRRDGDLIGERSFTTREPASATVKAELPSRLLCWSDGDRSALLDRNPSVRLTLQSVFGSNMAAKLVRSPGREETIDLSKLMDGGAAGPPGARPPVGCGVHFVVWRRRGAGPRRSRARTATRSCACWARAGWA